MFTPFQIYQVAGRKMLLVKSSINLRLRTMKAKWFQISAPMLKVDANFVPFVQEYGNYSTEAQSFTISGKSIEGPIKVVAPEGFLIRIDYNPPYYTGYYNWVRSGYINPDNRIVGEVTIWVMSRAFSTGIVTGQISITSLNMTPVKLWVETEVSTPELDTLPASDVEMTAFTSGLRFISRYAEVSQYGIAYRKAGDTEFTLNQLGTTLVADSFTGVVSGLLPQTAYDYFGYVIINSEMYTGQFRTMQTNEFSFTDSEGDVGVSSFEVGISSIVGYELVEEGYGIEYKKATETVWTSQQEGTTLSSDSFSVLVEDLEIGMDYNYRIYFVIQGVTYYSDTAIVSLLAPSLSTWTGTSITQVGFTTGALSVVGYSEVTQYGMQYKKSAASSWTTIQQGTSLSVDYFSQILAGLEPGVAYNYRSYIIVNGVTYYGDTKTASTTSASLNTTTADQVSSSSFRAGGNTIVGYQYASQYGIAYRTGGTGAFTHVSGGTSLGANSFLQTVLGLSSGTIYDYKAYIIISGVYIYGSKKQVITSEL